MEISKTTVKYRRMHLSTGKAVGGKVIPRKRVHSSARSSQPNLTLIFLTAKAKCNSDSSLDSFRTIRHTASGQHCRNYHRTSASKAEVTSSSCSSRAQMVRTEYNVQLLLLPRIRSFHLGRCTHSRPQTYMQVLGSCCFLTHAT